MYRHPLHSKLLTDAKCTSNPTWPRSEGAPDGRSSNRANRYWSNRKYKQTHGLGQTFRCSPLSRSTRGSRWRKRRRVYSARASRSSWGSSVKRARRRLKLFGFRAYSPEGVCLESAGYPFNSSDATQTRGVSTSLPWA